MSTFTDRSHRAALQAAIAQRADELRNAIDPPLMPQTPCEWITRLAMSLGCIAAAAPDDVEDYLVEHGADLLLWHEDLERERRAA